MKYAGKIWTFVDMCLAWLSTVSPRFTYAFLQTAKGLQRISIVGCSCDFLLVNSDTAPLQLEPGTCMPYEVLTYRMTAML